MNLALIYTLMAIIGAIFWVWVIIKSHRGFTLPKELIEEDENL